jgi:phosphoribosylformimino-5-aminoimidazole carboxamide ribonucleotide (ProFAR) isomerase
LKDIGKLKDKEVAGVIVGKAIYTGDVDLAEALKLA